MSLTDLLASASAFLQGSTVRLTIDLDHLLELGAPELDHQVLGPGGVGGQERQVDLGLLDARQLDLGLLGRLLEALEDHLVLRDVDAGVLLELGDQPVHQDVVDVVAAQVGVAVGRHDLDHLVADLQDGDVEGAAAEVVDRDQLVLGLVEPVGERGRGRLVDDALDLEPGDAAGVLGRLPLRVVEIGRHGDDRVLDRLAEVLLGRLLQLHEDARRDLLNGHPLAADLEGAVAVGRLDDLVRQPLDLVLRGRLVELASDEALGGEDCVFGVGDRLAPRDLADQDLALVIECDHGRREPVAFLVGDDLGLLALHDGHHAVGGAQVDTDDLGH